MINPLYKSSIKITHFDIHEDEKMSYAEKLMAAHEQTDHRIKKNDHFTSESMSSEYIYPHHSFII